MKVLIFHKDLGYFEPKELREVAPSPLWIWKHIRHSSSGIDWLLEPSLPCFFASSIYEFTTRTKACISNYPDLKYLRVTEDKYHILKMAEELVK